MSACGSQSDISTRTADKRKGAAHGPGGAHGSGDIRHQPSFRAWILGLSFVFLFVYVGLEVGYGGFVFAYAVKVFLSAFILKSSGPNPSQSYISPPPPYSIAQSNCPNPRPPM